MTCPLTKKVIKIGTVAVCIVIVLLFIIFPGYVAALIGPVLDQRSARRVLADAKTPDELRSAVGSLGAFFPLRDGSWIAVRYTDAHAAPGYSCAVAYDSGGQWFYSNYHFCGRFRSYSQIEKQTRELAVANGDSEAEIQRSLSHLDAQIFGLAAATDLVVARELLLKMGFSQ
jgi:hypothetical protein